MYENLSQDERLASGHGWIRLRWRTASTDEARESTQRMYAVIILTLTQRTIQLYTVVSWNTRLR